jgi:hypothetical protein
MPAQDAIDAVERELNETLKSARATTHARATREYDPEFERKLFAAIMQTLTAASFVQDANALTLRTAETIDALIAALACIVAFTPHAQSPTALRKYVVELSKQLRRKAIQAAADPVGREFKRRVLNNIDVGGRA